MNIKQIYDIKQQRQAKRNTRKQIAFSVLCLAVAGVFAGLGI